MVLMVTAKRSSQVDWVDENGLEGELANAGGSASLLVNDGRY
jgi:hypothetical protein